MAIFIGATGSRLIVYFTPSHLSSSVISIHVPSAGHCGARMNTLSKSTFGLPANRPQKNNGPQLSDPMLP